jgi:hypothetical protein
MFEISYACEHDAITRIITREEAIKNELPERVLILLLMDDIKGLKLDMQNVKASIPNSGTFKLNRQ